MIEVLAAAVVAYTCPCVCAARTQRGNRQMISRRPRQGFVARQHLFLRCDVNEKVAYIMGQVACALIEMEAMKALNQERQDKGQSLAYSEEAFLELQDKYSISHNAVLGYLHS